MENHKMLSIIVKAYNITYDIDEEDVEFAGVSSKEDLIKTLPKELELDVDFSTGNSIQQRTSPTSNRVRLPLPPLAPPRLRQPRMQVFDWTLRHPRRNTPL